MRSLAAIIALLAASLSASAQTGPPPLSPQCEAPGADISTVAPLPHLARKLEKGGKVRILAIGSSSTYGIGATSHRKTYPAQLRGILEKSLQGAEALIVNRGVSGEVAQTTADRLRTEVALEKPDVVLWQLGTNDALARVPPQDFERTVISTLEWLKSANIDVVLVGLQYTPQFARDQNYFAIREALLRAAAAENVLYVRRYDAMQFIARNNPGKVELMTNDGLHLNDMGYQCMAEHIAHAVIANLFVRKKDLPKGEPGAAEPPKPAAPGK
jgi:lysophospholipase L1-like esterase